MEEEKGTGTGELKTEAKHGKGMKNSEKLGKNGAPVIISPLPSSSLPQSKMNSCTKPTYCMLIDHKEAVYL